MSRPGATGSDGDDGPTRTPEAASAAAVPALGADLESWATSAADVGGPDRCRHPIRVLDEVGASVKEALCFPA